ncbi:hypothetical protein C8J57DRAFT_1247913 [Mycena rebaudengoi]|nr:hypothetical protein C8J57DRAFT_1247913 [Mycena rebaudengoi]
MDEALNGHPDVAQNLVKLFSDALTESRGKVKELEVSLSEKVLYAAEKESGFELLSAFEECVLDLNSKEADTLSSEGIGTERAVQLLHEKYDAAIREKIALQKSLETTASDMAAQEAALNQVFNEKILFTQVKHGEKVLIFGIVYACDFKPAARELALELGATEVFDLIELTNKTATGFTLTGSDSAFTLALAALRGNSVNFPVSTKLVLFFQANTDLGVLDELRAVQITGRKVVIPRHRD